MRWLCACTMVLGLGFALRADDSEDAAIKWVEGVGGKLKRDDKAPGKPVIEVDLNFNKKVTNDGLKNLAGLKSAKSLSLFFNEQITDTGMKHVKELPALEALTLSNTLVADAGIAELKGLKNLKALHLAGCIKMTDKATETIKGFAALEDLSLPSTITDAGVKNLADLKKLKKLYLAGCTKLTDGAVKLLADNVPELEYLELGAGSGTDITDAAVAHFARLKELKHLGVNGSKITATGLKELQSALPGCKISK
jgi:internalin A